MVGQLALVGCLLGGKRLDGRVSPTETRLERAGQLRVRLLVLRQNLRNGLVLDLEGWQRPHEVVAGKFLDLLVFRAKRAGFDAGLADNGLLVQKDFFLRLQGILHAVGVEIGDAQLGADAAHLRVGLLDFLALFAYLILEGGERAGENFLLLVDAFALVFVGDRVGQIGRFRGIRALHADLQEVGVAHLAHVDHGAQFEVGLLARPHAVGLGPFLDQLQVVDDRIEHLLALDDLELRGGKTRIEPHSTLVTVAENTDFLVVLLDLDDDVRLVLAGQEVGRDAGGDDHEQKSQDNDGKA